MFERGKMFILFASCLLVLYIVVGGFLGRVVARDDTYQNLSVFNESLKKVLDEYVGHPSIPNLTTGALRGLAQSVDMHSCYLTAEEYQLVQSRASSQGAIGAMLSPQAGYYRILQVLPGSPAAKAGLFPGDIVQEIEGQGTSEKCRPVILAMLAGEPGTSVRIGLLRGRDENLREFTVRREILEPAHVETKMLEEGTGYLKVPQLHTGILREAENAVNTLISSKAGRIVLDLRDCCDGDYDTAIRLAGLFLDKGIISIRRGQAIPETIATANPENVLFHGPLVVLVNGYTSGPAEILAAAIRDNGRGKLLGLKTYGTASEQKYFPLEDGAALYLTWIHYFTPKDHGFLNKKATLAGLKPDIKSPPEDFALSQYIDYEMSAGKESEENYRKYIDMVYQKQLEKALELIKNPDETSARPSS